MAPTHGFSKDQVASFQDVFKQFDTDGSGSISTSELSSALKLLKVEATDKQVADMLKSYDADGNGSLEFDEFVDMLWHLQNGPNEKEIRAEMFSVSRRVPAQARAVCACVCAHAQRLDASAHTLLGDSDSGYLLKRHESFERLRPRLAQGGRLPLALRSRATLPHCPRRRPPSLPPPRTTYPCRCLTSLSTVSLP